jgi:hypothetical protein
VVRLGIERVVDRDTGPRAEAEVRVDDRLPSTVCEDQIVARHQRGERIGRFRRDAFERSGRVHVPERHAARRAAQLEHAPLQVRVAHADAARLDHQVGGARGRETPVEVRVAVGVPHHHARPGRIGDVAVGLALEGVGLVEHHLVAARRQRAQQAAVVSGRSVPVGRDEAGCEERNAHAPTP